MLGWAQQQHSLTSTTNPNPICYLNNTFSERSLALVLVHWAPLTQLTAQAAAPAPCTLLVAVSDTAACITTKLTAAVGLQDVPLVQAPGQSQPYIRIEGNASYPESVTMVGQLVSNSTNRGGDSGGSNVQHAQQWTHTVYVRVVCCLAG